MSRKGKRQQAAAEEIARRRMETANAKYFHERLVGLDSDIAIMRETLTRLNGEIVKLKYPTKPAPSPTPAPATRGGEYDSSPYSDGYSDGHPRIFTLPFTRDELESLRYVLVDETRRCNVYSNFNPNSSRTKNAKHITAMLERVRGLLR